MTATAKVPPVSLLKASRLKGCSKTAIQTGLEKGELHGVKMDPDAQRSPWLVEVDALFEAWTPRTVGRPEIPAAPKRRKARKRPHGRAQRRRRSA